MIAILFLIGVGAGIFVVGTLLQVLGSDTKTDQELRAFAERRQLKSSAAPDATVEPDPATPLRDRIRSVLESGETDSTETAGRDGTDR